MVVALVPGAEVELEPPAPPCAVVWVAVVLVPLPGRAVLWPEETGGRTPMMELLAVPVVAGELEADEAPVEVADAEPEEMLETPPPQIELAASRAFWRSSLEQPFSRQRVAWERIFSWFSALQAQLRSVREQPVLVRAGSRQVICSGRLLIEAVHTGWWWQVGTYGALGEVGDVGELSGGEASGGENNGTLHFDGCVCVFGW